MTIASSWNPDLQDSGPVYLAITRALESDIQRGVLEAGDRLPPQRALAGALGVNLGTVSRAYSEARRRGLIRGEVGRGTFVVGLASQHPFDASDKREFIDLSLNLPLAQPGPDLSQALHQLAERSDLDRVAGYRESGGSQRVRQAGVQWLARLGVEVSSDQVVVCAGSQHGILVALSAVAGPGDLVLAEELTYPGFLAAARMLGLRVRGVPMDGAGLIPEELAALCASERPRLLYCMPSLQNPTALRLSERRREQIAELAAAHELTIVQDDIQGGFVKDPLPSLAALIPERVLTIAGLSKNFLPGLRVAFLAAAGIPAARLSELIWSSIWMASPIGSEIAAQWIEDGSGVRAMERRREVLARRHELAREVLEGLDFRTQPGAYHLWLQLPEPWDARSFASELEVRGVAISPADAFLASPGRAPRAVRVSLTGTLDTPQLRRGLAAIAQLAREDAHPTRVRL